MGWFVGYDGHFLFDNIGDSYLDNKVPYVAFRALPALMGALTVPTVFLIMWESGYSLPAAVTAAGLVLFDNAHIGQTRLILLDATLVLFMATSVLAYIRFYKFRHGPFGRKWWKWLLLTGISLSCVISTKYVGAFTFFTMGCAVLIDLWDLLDVNRGGGPLSLPTFGKHLMARVVGLIVVPFLFYLFWFQVHFAILSRSGPGDDFMTPDFQQTLSDNLMTASSIDIRYEDLITIRHKDTKTYLHSHPDKYPLRYDDGRVSSQGQQVTGYPFADMNNHWEILPAYEKDNKTGSDRPVQNGDIVQLRHAVTDTFLLTHDVASPYYPTNQEFTTVAPDLARESRFNETLFEIKMEHGKARQQFRSMSSHFKLVHHKTKIAMWTHTKPLPEWGYKQAEVNGNKNVQQSSNIWFVEEIPSISADSPRLVRETKKPKSMPFLKKYLELQRAMFHHNNALTSSHPYASQPFQWPFLLRGVSFWTQNDTRQQIYFLGNPIGYWIASSLLAVFIGIIGADQLAKRRDIDALDKRKFEVVSFKSLLTIAGTRSRLYNSTGFFFLCWAAHYLPFYLMGRQLFLHHYLPAHLASALVSGALLEFVCTTEPIIDEQKGVIEKDTLKKKVPNNARKAFETSRKRLQGQSLLALWAGSGLILTLVLWGWWFFLPLTYGKPGLSVEQVKARKWLNYDLHFAK